MSTAFYNQMIQHVDDTFTHTLMNIRQLSVEQRLTAEERRDLIKHIIRSCKSLQLETEKLLQKI